MLATLGSEAVPTTSRAPRDGWVQFSLADLTAESQAEALFHAYDLGAIYCVGGMTRVDQCELQPDLAFRINAIGPAVLASYARARCLPFVYFSSEYVFDGSGNNGGPYMETAPANPLSVYGKSKLEGEHRVMSAHPSAVILRTTVVYGPDPGAKNYVYSVLRTLATGKQMNVPDDQVSTPTYNRDLVRAAVGLVIAEESGTFHVCGPDLLGRLDRGAGVQRRGQRHALYQDVRRVIDPLAGEYDFEFVFTDNHSTDRTPELLRDLARARRIRAYRFRGISGISDRL
jgi:dTDP-4-dehydrorhamnose reductase